MTPAEALAAALHDTYGTDLDPFVFGDDDDAAALVLAALAAAGFAITRTGPLVMNDEAREATDRILGPVPADRKGAAALPVDGIVAELMGVEAHLDNARERLIKATNTLAALARLPEEERP